jgi:protein-S-isoprenylcysteine O-methyltransferase Ste14
MGRPVTISVSGGIIIWCWIIFGAYWFVNSFAQKKTAERQSIGSALVHRIPLGVSYCLLAIQTLPAPMNLLVTPNGLWARAAGVLVCVLGLFVTLWARRTLAGNWSSDVTFKTGHELIRRGPYRFVRHPIYTGLLIMCLGTTIEIARLRSWLALPLMAAAFWIKLKQEERLMLRHFPDEYRAYQKQVKALVPFVI